jgi:hypothetical protein
MGAGHDADLLRLSGPKVGTMTANYHPSFQQIAFVDADTGELQERRRQIFFLWAGRIETVRRGLSQGAGPISYSLQS